MLGKRSQLVIGKLGTILRSELLDTIKSPKNLLNCKGLQSSRGLKSYYCDQRGVGLGIVVALDNTSNSTCKVVCGGEILAKYTICTQFSNNSIPITFDSYSENTNEKLNHTFDKSIKDQDITFEDFEEEFTYVTCHGPNKSTTTRVYYGDSEYSSIKPNHSNQIGVFNLSSPAKYSGDHLNDHCRSSDSDFLGSCHLCRKGLQGKDIYMYRGEKAFCSEKCRQGQIRRDEKIEKCRSEASRTNEVSSGRDQIFYSGIVAV